MTTYLVLFFPSLVMSISVLSLISYSMCLFVHYFLFSHPWDNNFAILDKNIAKFFSLYSLHSIYTQRVKTCQNLTRTLPLIKMHQLQLVKLGAKTPGLTANIFNDLLSLLHTVHKTIFEHYIIQNNNSRKKTNVIGYYKVV